MIDRAETLYRNLPGLVSKAFLYDPETREYGGNYVWETRRDLEAFPVLRTVQGRHGEVWAAEDSADPSRGCLPRPGTLACPVPETIESTVE